MDKILAYLDELMERSAPQSPAWNRELQLGHTAPAWNYIDSCMVKALLEMYAITGEKRYLVFSDTFFCHYVDENGQILGYRPEDYNCDNINGGKVLFDLHRLTGRERYRLAIETLYRQLQSHPRTADGNFWHKKIYPHQVWLDGLYMVQPFFMEYEMCLNGKRNYRDPFTQLETVYHRMRDRQSGLLYHGYDESRQSFWADPETGLSRCFWTRSLGWYVMALVDTAEKLDEQLFYERETLAQILRDVLDALLRVADQATGMFYQVTDQGGRAGNYLETSGTCAIAYTLMKGARLGFLPTYYRDHGSRIFRAVAAEKLAEQDGALELRDICLVAGLGVYPGRGDYQPRDGSYAYYISEPRVANDAKGVAPFLLAFAEYYREELAK